MIELQNDQLVFSFPEVHEEASTSIENAVAAVVRSGRGPRELGGELTTRQTGDAIAAALRTPD